MKDQITAALDLIDGVVVAKPAPLLAFQIQGETPTGAIDPALSDLAQMPYSPDLGQGVCLTETRTEDLVPSDLRGDQRLVFWQLLVDQVF